MKIINQIHRFMHIVNNIREPEQFQSSFIGQVFTWCAKYSFRLVLVAELSKSFQKQILEKTDQIYKYEKNVLTIEPLDFGKALKDKGEMDSQFSYY